jgi:hypothetical protein
MVSRGLLCVIGAASAALAVVPSSASSAPRSVARNAALCPCFVASFSWVGMCIAVRMLEVSTRGPHLSSSGLHDRLMGLRLFGRVSRRSPLQMGSWLVWKAQRCEQLSWENKLHAMLHFSWFISYRATLRLKGGSASWSDSPATQRLRDLAKSPYDLTVNDAVTPARISSMQVRPVQLLSCHSPMERM